MTALAADLPPPPPEMLADAPAPQPEAAGGETLVLAREAVGHKLEDFQPLPAGTDDPAAYKRRASLNALTLLQKKIQSGVNQLTKHKITEEDLQKRIDNFETELQKRLDILAKKGAAPTNAPPPVPVELPDEGTLLEVLSARGSIQLHLDTVFQRALTEGVPTFGETETLVENAVNMVLCEINRSVAHITETGARIITVSQLFKDGRGRPELQHVYHSLSRKEFAIALGIVHLPSPLLSLKYRGRRINGEYWLHLWLGHENHTKFDSEQFVPPVNIRSAPAIPRSVYNIWSGFRISHTLAEEKGNAERGGKVLNGVVDEIFGHLGVESTNHFIAWMAHLLQHPGVLPKVAVVLRGPEGSGKGVWYSLLEELVGSVYCTHPASVKTITSKYCDMSGKLLVFVDEMFQVSHGSEAAEELKKRITEPSLTVERKFMSEVTYTNTARYLFAGNRDRIIQVDPNDRRFLLLSAAATADGRPRNLEHLFRPQTLLDIARYLYEYDLRDVVLTKLPRNEESYNQVITQLHGRLESIPYKFVTEDRHADLFRGPLPKRSVYDRYLNAANELNIRHGIKGYDGFWKWLSEFLPYKDLGNHKDGRKTDFGKRRDAGLFYAKKIGVPYKCLFPDSESLEGDVPAPAAVAVVAPVVAVAARGDADVACLSASAMWRKTGAAAAAEAVAAPMISFDEVLDSLDELLE
jgi:hypothetical protein